jgi:ferric-dicitrate binding protein FerR (iron transport regulator)
MCTFDKTKRSTKETNVNVERYFSWRDGVFIFKNDSLKSIMKKISRYYNVEIVIANTARAKETFSGYLDVRDNIKSVLQIIKEAGPKGFEFKFSTDDKIIIN